MPQHVVLTNPADGHIYTFDINPGFDAESKGGTQYGQKQRQIERTSNTGNVGLTKQQGEDGPFVIHWEFAVYSAAQEAALWQFYVLCKRQSIYLTDFAGEQYEGQITTLGRQRSGVLAGPRDTTQRKFFATYVFEFEVWRFISGLLAAAGVTA